MKLTYSVLWFDDDDEYLESLDQEFIQDKFSSWGFNCSIKLVSDPEQFLKEAPYKDYDIILVDYSLDAIEGHGQDFIKKIRDLHVLTEVIFYSSHSGDLLWDAVRQEKLEGIYVANRQNQGQIDKLFKVAQQSIQKVLDLENVRGIVMAEVGTNDELLSQIATKAFLQLPEDKQSSLMTKYVGYIESQCNSSIQKANNTIKETSFEELLILLDSAKKWNICQSLSKHIDWLSFDEIGNYQTDILSKRNFLAHGRPEKQEDGSLKFSFHNKDFIFSDEESLNLRVSLKAYGEYFENLVR
ncbi:response regulator [Vibrio diabolicus]|uniref:response regulator n=1 Tax=Vibrio diabolicus TaxID=50719 RepID=UPI003750850E